MKNIHLFFAIIFSSCGTGKFITKDKQSLVATEQGTRHYFFWGYFQNTIINGEDSCKEDERIAGVDVYTSIPNILYKSITLGIYCPVTYAIYCQKIVQRTKKLSFDFNSL
jgi:hypothetical protein